MSTIRVVWGTGSGPTKMASYDAALAEANVHNYNLIGVSSIVPEEATVEAVGTAPDLGRAGNRLTVVEARVTGTGPTTVTAGLGWTKREGSPGLFYEAEGETDEATIRNRIAGGLAAGRKLRDWSFGDPEYAVVSADAESGEYTTAVVIAAYGDSDPIV